MIKVHFFFRTDLGSETELAIVLKVLTDSAKLLHGVNRMTQKGAVDGVLSLV